VKKIELFSLIMAGWPSLLTFGNLCAFRNCFVPLMGSVTFTVMRKLNKSGGQSPLAVSLRYPHHSSALMD